MLYICRLFDELVALRYSDNFGRGSLRASLSCNGERNSRSNGGCLISRIHDEVCERPGKCFIANVGFGATSGVPRVFLCIRLFGHFESVIDFDTQISYGAL